MTLTEEKCSKCGNTNQKLYYSFGKYICETCKNNRPNKGTGNSGMYNVPQLDLFGASSEGIELMLVKKSNGLFGNLFFEHYPKSKGIVGRCLCYLIYRGKELLGIIGVSSPPCNYKIFREYFKVQEDNSYVNNNVFRLICHEKNLGTKILKIFRSQIKTDYMNKYKEPLRGIVTFVEKPRTGVIYKADNWDYLGKTQGKRMRRCPETWEKKFTDGEVKHIFGYKY